ncbi:hypothetical protein TRFO_01393 [Tritrichomonas foetus]|uniref:Autophagy protein 5 n=1 Tax=Tritrichomonas foetus TaxID=1144522 RepID=A0A1J4K8L4_9EUKA|nr:hypothetical protein TRFO_01393 [Tritrichomonas foetus]|eukprot:OHT07224.1 hypothetical protein TRFO_01393 [Tritrichomonas foetus]
MSEETINTIRKHVFESVVPLRISIAESPVPLCFNAPRNSTLGLFVYSKISVFLPEDTRNIWFSYDFKPVKWTLPIGVLYDVLIPSSDEFTPLRIEVKTADFPEGNIIRCESQEIASYYFCHSFKESLFLTDKNMDLTQRNAGLHQNIVKAVDQHDYETYKELFSLRFDNPISQWDKWPIRIVKSDLTIVQAYLQVEPGQTVSTILNARNLDSNEVIINGVSIKKDAPLEEVVPILLGADGFIYIVLK